MQGVGLREVQDVPGSIGIVHSGPNWQYCTDLVHLHINTIGFVGKEIFQCLLLRFNSNLKEESSFYKKVVITFVIFVDVVFSFCILNN